tara:strand:- start:999 stop:1871 length:873 start_codon:yes stop_codon:yes gene_type:complete
MGLCANPEGTRLHQTPPSVAKTKHVPLQHVAFMKYIKNPNIAHRQNSKMLDVIDLLVHSPVFVTATGNSLSQLRQTCTEIRDRVPVHLADPSTACARIIALNKGLPELQFAHEVLGCPVDRTTIQAAVAHGEIGTIDYVLSKDTWLEEGALIKATQLENLEVLEYLDKNYNRFDRFYKYKCVKDCLLSYGKVDLIDKLVAKGAKMSSLSNHGSFQHAIRRKDAASLEYLLKKGYKHEQDLPFVVACYNSVACLKWLNQQGYPNTHYRMMVAVAEEEEFTDMIEYLRECKI